MIKLMVHSFKIAYLVPNLLLVWIFLSPTISEGQEINPTYISIPDGLVTTNVTDLLQDSFGLLWFSTGNGLQMYDGSKMRTFKNVPGKSGSLQANDSWGLMEDKNHDIWVSNRLGVSRYIRSKGEFKNYKLSDFFDIPQNDASATAFKTFRDSQNRLWASTLNRGIIQFDAKNEKWEFAKYEIPGKKYEDNFDFSIALIEDKNGRIWAGSRNFGLVYRDKNDLAFKLVVDEQLSVLKTSNSITALFMDPSSTLWITTREGVYKYNTIEKILKTIIRYSDSNSDGWNNWNCINMDSDGNIWIANNFRGILKFEGITDKFEEVKISGRMKMGGHGWNYTLTRFTIDKSGIFWFGSREYGVLKYDPRNQPFGSISHDASNPNSPSPNGAYGILASTLHPELIYIGSRGYGFDIYNTENRTFKNIKFKAEEDRFGGSVRSMYEDKDGHLWLGTWGDGLIKLDKNYKEIKRYKNQLQQINSISNNQIRVIKEDKKGQIWVGTNNGLNVFDPKTEKFTRIQSSNTKTYPSIVFETINKLLKESQTIGIIDKVVDLQDKFINIKIEKENTFLVASVGEGDVFSMADYGLILNEKGDTVWQLGPYENTVHVGGAAKNRVEISALHMLPGNYKLQYKSDDSHSYDKWNESPPEFSSLYGIAIFAPKEEKFNKNLEKSLNVGPQIGLINGSNIGDIEISDPYVWVATESGLNRINSSTNELKSFTYDENNIQSISSNTIRDICVDKKGCVWIATSNGINKIDPITFKITRYSEEDGLSTNLTEAILEGDKGEMWIGTQSGITQMVSNEKLGKNTFINYNSSDGLGGDNFLALASIRDSKGKFYFGGDHGVTTFSNVSSNNIPPSIMLSNLFISNKSVLEMGNDSPLEGNLASTKNIELSYTQNSLSFEYVALHYANPQKNQYAHMLKGYDDDWIYDNRNFASYTNLEPGKYTFLIRASNAYGVWNEEGTSIEITINPPWWKTWWAITAFVVFFAILLYFFNKVMQRRIKLRERERTRENELKQAKEIEKAYTELKATQAQLIQSEKMASLGELTAGIAHEIQNPLNFVNNFSEISEEMIDELQEELIKGDMEEVKSIAADLKSNLSKINNHGKRASSIVKGMLEHSRNSGGEKILTDINALCDEYLRLAYHGLRAKDRNFNADFNTKFDESIPKISIVGQDIGRVVLNLINNGFQAIDEYAKSGIEGYKPELTISTKQNKGMVEIGIKDNGPGIPNEIRDKIFQPFFTTKPAGKGTGLGLSLAYDIVKAHGGELLMESSPGNGTLFTICLPIIATVNK